MERISIQAVSQLITSKAGKEYFTLEDYQQKRYVCFVAQLKDYCKVGSEIEADITPGKSPDDSPRVDMVYVDGKPVIQPVKASGRSFGKSKEELTQIRQLAEAQNRSIQAQVSMKLAVELALSESYDMPNDISAIKQIAKEFYQLLQSLTLISEAKVIHKEIIGDKDVKTPKDVSGKEIKPEPVAVTPRVDDIRGGVKTPQELMAWALSHDKKYGPSWVRQQAHIGVNAKISDEMVAEIHKSIKVAMGWDD